MIQTIKDAEIHILRLEREIEKLKKQVRIANQSGGIEQEQAARFVQENVTKIEESSYVLPDIVVAKQFHVKDTEYGPDPWKLMQSTEFGTPPPNQFVIIGPENAIMLFLNFNSATGASEMRIGTKFLQPAANLSCDLGKSNLQFKETYTETLNTLILKVLPNGFINVYDNTMSAYRVGADFDEFVVTEVTPIMQSINYKDHSNLNQSLNVCVGLNKTRIIVTYRKGIRLTPV